MHQGNPKSSFVTVLAWIFIVLSGFGTLIGILQGFMLMTMMNTPEMAQAMQVPVAAGAPPFAIFMMKNMFAFFMSMLALNVLTLVASVGLLLRRNWARVLFIGLMVFGILWNFAGLVLQFSMLSYMRQQFAAVPDAPDMSVFLMGVSIVSIVFVLAFSALFGWIIRRLMSAPVVAEFAR